MGDQNPYKPGIVDDDDGTANGDDVSPGLATYNVVSDTVAGFNYRISDNVFQAIFIAVFVMIGAGVGALLAFVYREPIPVGLFGGGFAGLVLGFLVSGVVLMVYRAIRHAKGKHD